MRLITAICAIATLAALTACSEPEDGFEQDEFTLKFDTGEFEVPPGDVFECFYTDVITDSELAVIGSFGQQGEGGHHITVYYTDIMHEPQHHPCDDAEMVDWHMIGGTGGNDGTGDSASENLRLPEGLGLRVPAGKQLVMQVHYINLGSTHTANDTVTLELMPADQLDAFVNQFLVLDVGFNVAAHQQDESVITCTVPKDLQLVKLLGHLHEWGTYYSLEEIDAEGVTKQMLYEAEWDPSYASNPPVDSYPKDEPLLLTKGMRLRQTCRWNNTEDYDLIFPREMCLSFGFYYPDVGEIFCELDE